MSFDARPSRYPARREKEPEPHVNLLWMWKGVRDANALREAFEARAGAHRVVARIRTDLERAPARLPRRAPGTFARVPL